MTLAHIGLGIVAMGITTMESRKLERDVALAPGEQVQLGDYTFLFKGTENVDGPNYEAVRARIEVLHKGKPETVMLPERRNYWVQQQSLAEAALATGWSRDLLATKVPNTRMPKTISMPRALETRPPIISGYRPTKKISAIRSSVP